VGEFDIGTLRRVRRQKEQNDLRDGTYTGGFEDVVPSTHTDSQRLRGSVGLGENDASCSDSEFSVYTFASRGSNVHVDGVALTEEAAETRNPDIIAIDMSATRKEGGVVGTNAVDGDDEDEGEGLQSIMTQV
jgi:hypothetical protein